MEDLQVLTQTWSGPLVVAMQILLILLVAWLLQRLVRRTVTRIGERYPVPPELLLPLRGGLRWLIMVSALIMVLERLGVSAEVLWTALTGFAAVAAVAFFAIWSVLSNLFCALLIFTVGPFRIGDRVELIDSADKPGVTGRVVAQSLVYDTGRNPRGWLAGPAAADSQQPVLPESRASLAWARFFNSNKKREITIYGMARQS